MGWDILQLVTW